MPHEQFIQIRFLKTVEKLSSVQIAEKLGISDIFLKKSHAIF